MTNFGIIYKATFPNGKIYIGQTKLSLEDRKKQHLMDLNKGNSAFHRAILKYGTDNVVWETIDTANSLDELNEKEIYWINVCKAYTRQKDSVGYNLTTGGGGIPGYIHTEEDRIKMSQNHADFSGENNPAFGRAGELCSFSKLNWDKVNEIRNRYIPLIVTLQQLADEYSVNLVTIWKVVNNKSWRQSL